MRARVSCVLMIVVLGLTSNAMALGPVAVSPGGETGMAVISQECPTFSWSQVEGAISYRLKVFERVSGDILSYEEMERTGGPVMSVEIKAPALSWTPSAGECLVSGERYVWYVVARQESGDESRSEGRGFEVEVGASAGLKDALKETVKEYLTKEWVSTESYQEVKEAIASQVTQEVKGLGGGGVVASQNVLPLGTEGTYNTFYGTGAGASIGTNTAGCDTFIGAGAGNSNTSGVYNTFVGCEAGYATSNGMANTYVGRLAGRNGNGSGNTFVGNEAGFANTIGWRNTTIGEFSGRNNTGDSNVFIGWSTGYNEAGSNKLYIANSDTATPLIYGEFNNSKLTVNGNLEVIGPDQGLVRLSNVTTDNTTKASRMVLRHYSDAQLPVYLFGAASTLTNSFVAFGGGNPIGNAATQLDLFTAPNTTTPTGFPRLTIIGNGYVGIGTQTPSNPLHMASGARATTGGTWEDASSREYKEEIESLTQDEAMHTLMGLQPVKFAYKADPSERHVGFIAEDVPALVATKDRKGMSPMDVVAVLTKVVQDQQKVNEKQQKTIDDLSAEVRELKNELRLRATTASVDFSK